MSVEWEGKVAIVTGAASGIGRSLAKRALELGMSVVLIDRDEPRLERTTELFQQQYVGRAIALAVELSDIDSIQQALEQMQKEFGRIDLLFNNAGISSGIKRTWEYTPADYRSIFDANVITLTNCLSVFIPQMIGQAHSSRVINTASSAGYLPHGGLAAYAATKHAIIGISEILRTDLREIAAAVDVSVLCPAWVKTNIVGSMPSATSAKVDDPQLRSILRHISQGMHPDDVATIAFDAISRGDFYIFTDPDVDDRFRSSVRM